MSSSNLLPIAIDAHAPLPIAVQVSEQIKLLIAIEYLRAGDSLPTVIQLAQDLNINHNTIALVYSELIETGYLVAKRGKGTFVAKSELLQKSISRNSLYRVLEQAFLIATQMELSASEFGLTAYAVAVSSHERKQVVPLKIVFVESLQSEADLYFHSLQSEISHPLSLLYLENLQTGQPVDLKEFHSSDLVITNSQYVWDLTQITTPKQEVIGVNFEPDLQLLTKISSLNRGSQVLLVSQKSGEGKNMKQMLEKSGVSHLNLKSVNIENIESYFQLFNHADIICASKSVCDYICEISPQSEKVINFTFIINRASLSVLKTRLVAVQMKN
ncbi:MAG: GntR family transcriptional regulator [Pelatocladus maniniholoensis HA4357-MV3]|jgi:DNA-binding transcriptional regulator YhcF (GntR family)|uniref:GntR family transcriptional regulator n=1 Tax=Pelatocladus maniniholoensis HA4357-MV3 TaxID=1117104 RepID=A0A9E3H898_9NOST|nr:GntR family transcriptional regulator [Pelatocladus maniniholoensis HA4357-MV3]BAZ70608.1 GntR family transcriptional regulator [Fischerella sp. NIES-4106]